jgi:glycerol uptake facilitator-like aquaporin
VTWSRRLAAEALGSLLLAATVIGSGVMAEQLAAGNAAVALLTSFANPAITIARALSDTFAGIRPADVSAFVLAQTIGALAAWRAASWLLGRDSPASRR